MSFTAANITALIVAASFAGGLNIYATVLTLGVLARTHWVALPPGLDGLGNTWVILTCALLFAVELVADKIPGFDMVWNGLQTVVRVLVAAGMAVSLLLLAGLAARALFQAIRKAFGRVPGLRKAETLTRTP